MVASRFLPCDNTIQSFFLISLSLLLLPLSSLVTAAAYVAQRLLWPWTRAQQHREECRAEVGFRQRTVLVTGVGMAKGLTLARAFHLCGHRVVGADFERHGMLPSCPGRWSDALDKFYSLPVPSSEEDSLATQVYISNMLSIIQSEGVDLWVSCSGVATSVLDSRVKEAVGKSKAPDHLYNHRCACIQFDAETTAKLHDKDSFIAYTNDLGLPVPETHRITSLAEIHTHLALNDGHFKFILKTVGMEDAYRGNMTLLPCDTPRQTQDYISSLPVSPKNPWILQQFIPGNTEYCTHALVVRGAVKVFAACPSSEMQMHYSSISVSRPDGPGQAMLDFTRNFLARCEDGVGMTGHLSFDFMVDSTTGEMYAIECNPRAHTAVVLFSRPGPEMRAMVRAYLAALDPFSQTDNERADTGAHRIVAPPDTATPPGYYWIGHDLVEYVLDPLWRLITFRLGVVAVVDCVWEFAGRAMRWKEGTFEVWDPLPFFVLYHVYWPVAIFMAWWEGRRWSKLNVSTTKMFAC